jgi:hypothetical protein
MKDAARMKVAVGISILSYMHRTEILHFYHHKDCGPKNGGC